MVESRRGMGIWTRDGERGQRARVENDADAGGVHERRKRAGVCAKLSPRQPKCAGKVGEVESGCSGGEKEREKGEGAWSAKFGQRGGECRTVHTAKSEHQATVDAMHR